MKPGAVKMRYPGGDPENGPAYMQQWTGTEWQCLHHKPIYDDADQGVWCRNCGLVIMDRAKVKAIIRKHRR
jgi:hypothetical protein